MTAIIKKLRRKRKLSSELHSRWGDMSITYPNEGSWSQCEQPPGAVSNAARGQSPLRSWRHDSAESLDRYNHSPPIPGVLRSASPGERHPSTDSAATIPTGYYDARVRGRSKRVPPPLGSTSEQRRHSHDNPREDVPDTGDSTSSAPGGSRGGRRSDEKHHRRARDDADPYSRASRSPPLSVTSRMRRHSAQSSTTEPTPSMPNTASSKHTSLTSSVPSVPSVQIEDIRPAPLTVYHEKKQSRRSKPREADPVVRQELVPSYEDLYG